MLEFSDAVHLDSDALDSEQVSRPASGLRQWIGTQPARASGLKRAPHRSCISTDSRACSEIASGVERDGRGRRLPATSLPYCRATVSDGEPVPPRLEIDLAMLVARSPEQLLVGGRRTPPERATIRPKLRSHGFSPLRTASEDDSGLGDALSE